MYRILIALCLVAMALSSPHENDSYGRNDHHNEGYGHGGRGGYGYNPDHARNRYREAQVNHYNGERQHWVNAAAEHYGAGTGTARYYGVPGTGVGGYGYGHGYGHGGYGNHGYSAGYGK